MTDRMKLPLELTRPLAFIDLESTGLSTTRDRIVELAVLRLSPGGDVVERVRRFNPGIPIPPAATAIHGIRDKDVLDEAPFSARARSLVAFLDPCDLAGFNVRRFDLPLLLAEFRRSGVLFSMEGRRIVDVQMIFHREEPRDLTAAARFYLGRDHEDAHSALGDIRTSAAVLAAQLRRYDLPRSLDELHRYCDDVAPFQTELEKWFEEVETGRYLFRRGKHSGSMLAVVARDAPDYLQWMITTEDMDDAVIALVRQALDEAWEVS